MGIESIREKVRGAERLSRDDALFLLAQASILDLGQLAMEVRRRRHPEPIVTFVVDTNPNYTNVCNVDCTFCAFYRPPGHDEAYTHSIDEMMERIARSVEQGVTTVLMQGGVNPELPLDYYVDMVRAVRERFPETPLMVDANSAYAPNDLPVFKELDRLGLMMIEQPLAYDDLWDHARLQKEIETPICLDESVRSPADARRALEMGACRVINIKAGRVGGLSRARGVQEVAAAHGVPVWCGGMLETGIGRAHNVHLSALPNFTLPGDVAASQRYYAEDLIDPPVEVRPDGTIAVPDGPGIGYAVREDRIAKHTLRYVELTRP